jgi:ribosomal protein L44E
MIFVGQPFGLQAVFQTARHAGKRVRRLKACPTEIMKTLNRRFRRSQAASGLFYTVYPDLNRNIQKCFTLFCFSLPFSSL